MSALSSNNVPPSGIADNKHFHKKLKVFNGQQHVMYATIRLMHESAIGGHDQWLPRFRSNIGIGNESVGSFLLVLYSMALYTIWNMLCNLISE